MVKYVLRTVVIGIIVILGVYLKIKGVQFIMQESSTKTTTNCGIVTSVLPGQRQAKYNLVDELYLGVKFDSGRFEAIEVSPTTFMNKKIGDRVCFTEEIKPDFDSWEAIFGILGLFLILMEVSIGLVYFGAWLFTEED